MVLSKFLTKLNELRKLSLIGLMSQDCYPTGLFLKWDQRLPLL